MPDKMSEASVLGESFWQTAPYLGTGGAVLLAVIAVIGKIAAYQFRLQREAIRSGTPEALKIVNDLGFIDGWVQRAPEKTTEDRERKAELTRVASEKILELKEQRANQVFFGFVFGTVVFAILAIVAFVGQPATPAPSRDIDTK